MDNQEVFSLSTTAEDRGLTTDDSSVDRGLSTVDFSGFLPATLRQHDIYFLVEIKYKVVGLPNGG